MSKNEEKISMSSKVNISPEVISSNELNTPATLALKDNKDVPPIESISVELQERKNEDKVNVNGIVLSPLVALKSSKETEPIEPPYNPKSNSSILGAAMTQINICLGASIFTFGIRGKQFGLVWILAINFVCAFINYWSITRQVQGSEKLIENEYPEIIGKVLGKKFKNIFNVTLIIFDLGILMTFLTIIYECLGRFIQSIFFHDSYFYFDDFNNDYWGKLYFRFPIIFGMSFLMALICLSKDMGKLSFMSYIAVGSVLYTMLIILIQVKGYYNHYKETEYDPEDENTYVNYTDLSKAFTSKLDFFKGMSSLFYAYACQTGIYPVYNTFKPEKNSVEKMKKSTMIAMVVTSIFHVIAITCGYLTEPVDPKSLIIFRQPKDNGYDILMNIAKLAVAISIFFSGPPNYMSARISFADVFTDGKIGKQFNYFLTFSLLAFCATVSSLYDKVLNYMNYLGGFVAVFFSYLFPILIYIKTNGKPFTHWQNILELSFAILLCIIGYIAGIRTVIDDFS